MAAAVDHLVWFLIEYLGTPGFPLDNMGELLGRVGTPLVNKPRA